jgi:hypothetical protein
MCQARIMQEMNTLSTADAILEAEQLAHLFLTENLPTTSI